LIEEGPDDIHLEHVIDLQAIRGQGDHLGDLDLDDIRGFQAIGGEGDLGEFPRGFEFGGRGGLLQTAVIEVHGSATWGNQEA